jgi:hypothetical protein
LPVEEYYSFLKTHCCFVNAIRVSPHASTGGYPETANPLFILRKPVPNSNPTGNLPRYSTRRIATVFSRSHRCLHLFACREKTFWNKTEGLRSTPNAFGKGGVPGIDEFQPSSFLEAYNSQTKHHA